MKLKSFRKDAASKRDEALEDVKTPAETSDNTQSDSQYPPFKVVLPTVLSLYLTVFLVALVGSSEHIRDPQLTLVN